MKKKIFFLYSRDIERNDSGGSRTLIMQIEYLASHGFECHCLFNIIDGPKENVVYYQKENDYIKQARRIIVENNIHIAMIPEAFYYAESLSKTFKGTNCKIVSALHSKPGYDRCRLYILLLESMCYNESIVKRLRAAVLLLIYPVFYLLYCLQDYKRFHNAYVNVDYLVLLAKSFIPEYSRIYNVPQEKLRAVGNAISFDQFATDQDIENKNKTILIVARFEERSKRILMSLKIWEQIQDRYPDWNLEIVGFGRSKPLYVDYIKKHELKRVTLAGKQAPLEYYKRASIFMMTSAYEGWGMTIVEAMQMGCVPVVMDSFSALYEIVDKGVNGYIVENSNLKQFADKLSSLIENSDLRKNLAIAAVQKSHAWEPDKVYSKYADIYNSILED